MKYQMSILLKWMNGLIWKWDWQKIVGIAQRNDWACGQNQEGVNWFLNNKINTLKFFQNLSSRSINNFFITQ